MVPYQYVISLRIWHPTIPHEEISRVVGRNPKRCWTVGTPRFSPKGTPLGGLRDTTYWSAPLTSETTLSEPIEVEKAIATWIDELTMLSAFFNKIRSDGGKAEFFVGLFSERNIEIDFEPSLMGKLAQTSLSIFLDYYPRERDESTE
jgi:hypothetical protein